MRSPQPSFVESRDWSSIFARLQSFFTVRSETPISRAISGLVRPPNTRRLTTRAARSCFAASISSASAAASSPSSSL